MGNIVIFGDPRHGPLALAAEREHRLSLASDLIGRVSAKGIGISGGAQQPKRIWRTAKSISLAISRGPFVRRREGDESCLLAI